MPLLLGARRGTAVGGELRAVSGLRPSYGSVLQQGLRLVAPRPAAPATMLGARVADCKTLCALTGLILARLVLPGKRGQAGRRGVVDNTPRATS